MDTIDIIGILKLKLESKEEKEDCFIWQYIEQLDENDTESSNWKLELKVAILDLFGAGSETTSTTLAFALQYLAKNKEVKFGLQNQNSTRISNRLFTDSNAIVD